MNDPQIDECVVKTGNEVLPKILNGDPKFHLPSLNPLFIPSVELISGSNLKMDFKDLNVYGLETLKLTKNKLDFKERKWTFYGNLDYLSFRGNYKMDGRILVLPISGSGPCNITLGECNCLNNKK